MLQHIRDTLRRSLANLVTFGRLLCMLLATLILFKNRTLCVVFLLLAILSDLFDGYIARRLSTESRGGAIFDAVTDAVSVLVFFIALFVEGYISTLYLLLMLCRFLVMLVANSINYRRGRGFLESSSIGKKAIALFAFLVVVYIISYDSVISEISIGTGVAVYSLSSLLYLYEALK